MYAYERAYREGYDDGFDDGYVAARNTYLEECRQLRDVLRAILEHGEAPERETSR